MEEELQAITDQVRARLNSDSGQARYGHVNQSPPISFGHTLEEFVARVHPVLAAHLGDAHARGGHPPAEVIAALAKALLRPHDPAVPVGPRRP